MSQMNPVNNGMPHVDTTQLLSSQPGMASGMTATTLGDISNAFAQNTGAIPKNTSTFGSQQHHHQQQLMQHLQHSQPQPQSQPQNQQQQQVHQFQQQTQPQQQANNMILGNDYWLKLDAMLNTKVKVIEDKFDAAIGGLTTEVKMLSDKCAQYEEDITSLKSIVAKQQQSINRFDSKERICNIMIGGLSETDIIDNDVNLSTDLQKITAVLGKIGVALPNNHTIIRLGQPSNNPSFHRYVKLTLESKEQRDQILQKARELKDKGEPWCKTYLKRDLHPAVLHENKRLWKKKKVMQQDEQYKNKEIKIDKGKLLVDGAVVDCNILQSFH